MCLEKVTYPHRITHGKPIGLGFKSGYHHVMPRVSRTPYKLAKPGVWYTCDDLKLDDNYDSEYKGGFHVLLTADDANNYDAAHDALYLVEYSNILHIGTQYLYDSQKYAACVIAEKIRYIGKNGYNRPYRAFNDLKTGAYIGSYK